MGLNRLIHGICRQMAAQDPLTGSDVSQVGDSVNNAIRVNNVVLAHQVLPPLLAPATRNSTVASAAQVSSDGVGVLLCLNVTAASGTGGLGMVVQYQEPISGAWLNYTQYSPTVTAIGFSLLLLHPCASSNLGGTVTNKATGPLPVNWRVYVNAGDASNYTYSVSAIVFSH